MSEMKLPRATEKLPTWFGAKQGKANVARTCRTTLKTKDIHHCPLHPPPTAGHCPTSAGAGGELTRQAAPVAQAVHTGPAVVEAQCFQVWGLTAKGTQLAYH